MGLSDLELSRLSLQEHYRFDEQSRLLSDSERQTPKFLLSRTTGGIVHHCSDDLPDEIVSELDSVVQTEPSPGNLQAPPVGLERYTRIMKSHTTVTSKMELAYRSSFEVSSSIPVVRIDPSSLDLLREIFPDLDVDLDHPCVAVIREGRAVSVCQTVGFSTITQTAGVDTMEKYRMQGFASAVTAAWATNVRDSGCIPLYSTSLENVASQGVARTSGMRLYASNLRLS